MLSNKSDAFFDNFLQMYISVSWDYSHEQIDSVQTVSCDSDPVHRSRKVDILHVMKRVHVFVLL